MSNRDVKAEARRKLALNMHQAIATYTIEFVIIITLISLLSLAAVCIELASGMAVVAAVVMILYGIALLLIAVTGCGLINYAMIDHYLVSYKCKPYNFRRTGEVLTRTGIVRVFTLNLIRTLLGFLLTLLLIVPGVIYFSRTSMANHLLAANPKMKPTTALHASSKVMIGKTSIYMSLIASFIGWFALGVATLGIGFVFVLPYVNLAKTVYYKRNLQGDKTVYLPSAQPQSLDQPVPSAQPQFIPPQAQNAARPAESDYSEVVRPVVVEHMPPPIDTLGAADIEDMNATIQQFNNDVPEVPLTPVTGSRKVTNPDTVTPQPDQPDSSVQSQPAAPQAQSQVQQPADSEIVEIVTPLTTQELRDPDEMDRQRYDTMFSGDRKPPVRDYFSNSGNANAANGFVDSFDDPESPTAVHAEPVNSVHVEQVAEPAPSEVEQEELIMPVIERPQTERTSHVRHERDPHIAPPFRTSAPVSPRHSEEESAPDYEVISDAQLDEFLRGFDVADTETPSVSSRRPSGDERPQAPRREPADMSATSRSTRPSSNVDNSGNDAEKRRLEREERIRKLRNSKK